MGLEVGRNYFGFLPMVDHDEGHPVAAGEGKQGHCLKIGSRNMVGSLRKVAQEAHPSSGLFRLGVESRIACSILEMLAEPHSTARVSYHRDVKSYLDLVQEKA